MRKKSGIKNGRKFKNPLKFRKSKSTGEDSDWVQLDAYTTVSARAPVRRGTSKKGLAIRALAILCLCVSIPLGAKWAYANIFYKNEEFVLQRLDISSDGLLSKAKLSEIANVSPGMNLMELDLGLIQDQIELLPQVAKVSVNREMPDRLVIQVRERIGVAWLSCPPQGIRPWDMERGFLMDDHGYLFRCLDLTDAMKSLPVVETFKLDAPTEGSSLDSAPARNALKLIIESERLFPAEGMLVEKIRLTNEWSMECAYRNGLKVTYDVYDVPRGLDDLALILLETEKAGQTLLTVNVVAKKNIPVTFAESAIPVSQGGDNASPAAIEVPKPPAKPELSGQEKHLHSILSGG
ncbi:MAG: FtsQ-type POTRA domain-containing protein [Verrucomicrobiales bacterium]|nr:FtsQ-type POTRA domain-containing protein [Verrucomicrobiales bacterium]